MKNLVENIKLVVSMTIIGAILLYIGTLVLMPDMTVKIFRFQPFVVVTESMEPYLNVNDMVVVTPFDIDEAEVGDVITFKADIDYNGTEEVVTHYIYSIETTKGETFIRTNRYFEEDEIVVPDTWLIQEQDVIGSYGFHLKYVGFIIGFLKSFYGIAIVIINVVIFSLISYINKKQKQEAQTPPNSNHKNITPNPSL